MQEVDGVQTIKDLQEKIEEKQAGAKVSNVKWLFRGQSRVYPKNRELLPRIYRLGTWSPDGDVPGSAFGAHTKEREVEALKHFVHEVSRNPEAMVRLRRSELPRTYLDWMALAQHHWLPTRLLDWTERRLKALWFALWGREEKPTLWMLPVQNEDICQPLDRNGQVIAPTQTEIARRWQVRPARSASRTARNTWIPVRNPFTGRGHPNRTLFYQPTVNHPRVSAQEGWLMVVPDRKEGGEGPQTALETNKRYDKDGVEELVCLRIDVAMRGALQVELMREHRIDQRTLFPDADGLGHDLGLRIQLGASLAGPR